jgi:LmbE family N-acetylglucosaminyl deacetylase
MSLLNAASATMSFVAHIDDDLLFQNPDIQDSITAGGGHTTVYLTAGDAGRDDDHWQAREAGAKSAYAEMAGTNDWVDAVATFGNAETSIEVQTSYLESQPEIRLYFLRLPDGYIAGNGYSVTGNQSLEQLWEGEIESISSLDGANTVNADQLSGLLLGLMNHHQPDEILIQDHSSEYATSNHSDHVSSSLFAYDARQYYDREHEVHAYIEYATSDLVSNQTPEDSQRNLDAFHAYLRGYSGETDPTVLPPVGSRYLAWTSRNYHLDEIETVEGSLSQSQTFSTLDFVSETVATGDGHSAMIGSAGGDSLVVPCFTPGTLIATAKGECRVEDLVVGDRVITRDNGMQQIRWLGRCDMPGEVLFSNAHLRPILIRQGALGNDLPLRDMMVSPQHRVLISSDRTSLYFDTPEVLVPAKHLTRMEGIDVVDVPHTSYIHFMFDRHEIVLSDGIWTESFQPGDMSLAALGEASRKELNELFPDLNPHQWVNSYTASRRSLKSYEALVITNT